MDYAKIIEAAGAVYVDTVNHAITGPVVRFRAHADAPILRLYARSISAENVRLAVKNYHESLKAEAWQNFLPGDSRDLRSYPRF